MIGKEFVNELKVKMDHLAQNPDSIIQINNEKITLRDYREMEKMHNVSLSDNNDCFNFLVYWDDVIQYTSLGLLSWLVEKKKLDPNLMDVQKFFDRNECDGLQYISQITEIDYNEILSLYEKNYQNILLLSPMSEVLMSLINMQKIMKSITFVFKYGFDDIDHLIADIKKNHLIKLEPNYIISDNQSMKLTIDKQLLDVIFTGDMGEALEYVIEQDVMDATIVGPKNHFNIDHEYLIVYFTLGEEYSLLNSKLFFIEESILGYSEYISQQKDKKR